MTIYVVFKTARQIEGEYVFISAEKAFKEPQKAEQFWKERSPNLWQEDVIVPSQVPGSLPEKIPCQCERAIHPVEVDFDIN
jgi:hypothetical protein